MKTALFHVVVLSLCQGLVNEDSAWAYPGDRPPKDSYDATCQYSEQQRPKYCRIKVEPLKKSISIWSPPGVQSAMTMTYAVACFQPGCRLTGPDLGYIDGPKKYRLLTITDAMIQFVSDNDKLNAPRVTTINIYRWYDQRLAWPQLFTFMPSNFLAASILHTNSVFC